MIYLITNYPKKINIIDVNDEKMRIRNYNFFSGDKVREINHLWDNK